MKKILFVAMFIFSFQTIAFCQNDNDVIKNAVSKLKTLLTDHITEKAYLHFDRPYLSYVAGDVVYFKAYVTMGELHEPSTISGMLHVDLINKNDVLMQSVILQLNGGTGWGDFALPDTLQKGTYRIRAYTEWMRNEKNPNFFDQYISVGSINSVDRIAEAVTQGAQPNLQFFPEGGNLVTDIHSKVGFKAIGPDGLGMNVKGVVVDNENKEVAKIASTHLGMGVFDFIPEEGRTYKAKITFANGSKSTLDLPVESKGITLSVNTDDPEKVSIEIKANRAYYKENLNKVLNLLIYWGGAIRTYNPKLDNEVLGLDLPAKDFRTGVLQVTLLSQTGEPLNERLAFIQNPDLLNLSLSANKPSFAKRENVQLNLNAKNKEGSAVNGFFSVSVVDESKVLVDENTEHSILSYLLLSSDVKGYVEKPNYYFANVNKQTRADLDALMLTQGYRRFVWKQLMSDNSNVAAAHIPEQYLDISGKLTTKAGAPIANAKITLVQLAQTETTDDQGRFRFAKIDPVSGTNFVLKTSSSSGKNAAVLTLDKPAPGPIISPANLIDAKYNTNADLLASAQNNSGNNPMTARTQSVLLKGDNITGPQRSDSYRSSSLSGPGHADQVIHGDQIRNASSLSNGLNGVARGVDFINGVPYLKGSQVVSMGSSVSEGMLLVLDGTTMKGSSSIDNINPASVETVEILKGNNAAIYGNDGSAGVIVVTTRQGGGEAIAPSKEMTPGVFSIVPTGYYRAREFYSPRYDAGQQVNKLSDLRTTIFWKPDVATDAQGNASFKYFNADGTGTYRVVVEGWDSKGTLGRQVFKYKVE